jgi:hypothetical protein
MLLHFVFFLIPHISIAAARPEIPDPPSQYVLEPPLALVLERIPDPHRMIHPASSSPLRPSIEQDFPDPAIIKSHDGWYSFGTSKKGTHVQMAFSKDFAKWTVRNEDAMPKLPGWVNGREPAVWAPDVIQNVRVKPTAKYQC